MGGGYVITNQLNKSTIQKHAYHQPVTCQISIQNGEIGMRVTLLWLLQALERVASDIMHHLLNYMALCFSVTDELCQVICPFSVYLPQRNRS